MLNEKDNTDFFTEGALPTLNRTKINALEAQETIKDERTIADSFDIIDKSIQANLNLYTPVFSGAHTIRNAVETDYELLSGEPTINPLDPQYLDAMIPEYFDQYMRARTDGEWNRIHNRIRSEQESRETEQTLTGALISLPAIAATDPASYVPIASVLKASTVAGGFVKGAATALPGALAGGVASEALLLATQETKSIQEATFELGVQTILGAALGGGIGVLAAKATEKEAFTYMAEQELKGNTTKTVIDDDGTPVAINTYTVNTGANSVGAAETKPLDYKGDRLVGYNKDTPIFHPARAFFWGTGTLTQHPVIKALRSPSPAVASFGNEILDHNFDLVKTLAGQNLTHSMQLKLRRYDTAAIRANIDIRDAYFEYLGLDPSKPVTNEVIYKLSGSSANKLPETEFNRQMIIAAVSDEYNGDPFIKSKAREIYDRHLKPINEALIADGILSSEAPAGAEFWLGRISDKNYLTNNRTKAVAFYKEQYIKTNELVSDATSRLRELKQSLASAKELGLEDEIKSLKKQVAKEQKFIDDNVLKGVYSDDMVIGDAGIHTYEEIQKLTELRKPIKQAKKELKFLEKQLSVETRAANPNRKPGQPNAPHNETQLKILADIEKQKELLENLRYEINELAIKKQIPESFTFYNKAKDRYFLKKPDRGTKRLRKVLDDDELTLSAERTVQNRLDENVVDMAQDLIGARKAGSNGITDVGRRADMISDKLLYENKILLGDIHSVMRSAIKQAGQLLEWNRYLKSKGWDGKGTHLEFLAHAIDEDYNRLRMAAASKHGATIEKVAGKEQSYTIKNPPKDPKAAKALDKELAELTRQQQSDVANVQDMYTRITNTYDKKMKKLIQIQSISNKYAYATQLGALLLSMAGETVSTSYRTGLLNYLKDGVIPGIANWAGIGKGKAFSAALREQAADIGLGLEFRQALMMQSLGLEVEGELAVNALERQLGKLSSGMSILNFSAGVSDTLNTVATTAVVSGFIRDLQKYKAGKLSKNRIADLALYGLADKNEIDGILSAFAQHGETSNGGYLANWGRWDQSIEQIKAAKLLQDATLKKVKSVLFSGPSAASFPSGVDPNGAFRSLFIFMGWSLQANANYFLPLIQRVDPRKASGVAAMIGVSMFTDPLRKIATNEEPNLDPKHLFTQGILNSGTLGIFIEAFNKLNAVGEVFPDLVRDKDRGKGLSLVVGGSLGSFAEGALKIAGQAFSNEWNESDLKRVSRIIPLLGAVEFRYLTAKAIEGLNLPKTRREARDQNGTD